MIIIVFEFFVEYRLVSICEEVVRGFGKKMVFIFIKLIIIFYDLKVIGLNIYKVVM